MKRTVEVTFTVEVETDDEKFTPEFLAEYRASHYPFVDIFDHVEHIAQLEARGMLDSFTDGYGQLVDFGIRAEVINCDTEVYP